MPEQRIYHFKPSRAELVTDPDAWTDAENETAEAHFAYLKQACADRIVILAGRALDGIGPAVVILDIADEAEARAFMENDPFVKSGLMLAELHPFRAALVRK